MANEEICRNNKAKMFVTVWMGILEISTGHLTCASAGHEFPAVRGEDKTFRLFKDPHGFVLGGEYRICPHNLRTFQLTIAQIESRFNGLAKPFPGADILCYSITTVGFSPLRCTLREDAH